MLVARTRAGPPFCSPWRAVASCEAADPPPRRRPHSAVLVVDATRCHRLVLQKGGVGRFVVLFFTCCYKVEPAAQTFFCNSFSIFCGPGFGAGLLPPADRAAAESDVAGLGSEATATFGVEWLKPLLQHSDSDESSPAKMLLCEEARPGPH